MEQGIDQRQTNIDIILLKHNINKTLYSTQLKETSQERLKSEVKWTKKFQNYDIVWKLAYKMSHRCTIDIKLRNFHYKYLMRIIPNNKNLFKCKLAPTVLCDFVQCRKKPMHTYSGTVILCKGIGQKSKSFYKITILN